MNKHTIFCKPLPWLAASLLAILVAGCGGSGDGIASSPTVAGAGSGLSGLGRGPTPVVLGGGGNFAILTKTGVTNVPTSAIIGNVGASPITSAAMNNVSCIEVTGSAPLPSGFIYGVDMAYVGNGATACFKGTAPDKTLVDNAVADMGTAYTDAAGRTPDYIELGAGNIGGMTLAPATYKWGTALLIPTSVTLNGGPNDVWIFQVAQGITQASAARVILTGGALPKNIFWQSFGAVGLGTTAHMEGVILSQTSITLGTGASVNGRLLAQTAVVLDSNAVTQPAP